VTEEQIDALRKKRWAEGEKHYRPDGGPFVGDPMREYVEEQLDALNYLDVQMVRARLANDGQQAEVLMVLAFLSRRALAMVQIATSEVIGSEVRDSKLVKAN
jgi:hypothetical protein